MATTASDQGPPDLAIPIRRGRASFFGFLLRRRGNWLETFDEEAYETPVLVQRLLWRRSLVLNDPAAVKRVLLDNAGNYAKTAVARRLLEPGLGQGLITMEGERWRRHRRLLAPAFDHQSIAAAVPVMAEVAAGLGARWARLPPGEIVDMTEAMPRATLRVIARTMFSIESDAIEDSVAAAVRLYQKKLYPSLLDLLGMPGWIPRPREWGVRRGLAGFHGVMDEVIAARRRTPAAAPPDLLSLLIEARDAAGAALSEREVHDHVVTILMAGHETISIALAWTWYLLAQHRRVEETLHAELDRVLAGRAPGAGDLPHLAYTRMVIEEAMRLYPPAHTISRVALGDDELSGQRIGRGGLVLIVPWLIHRHRRLWERPERFEPERFHPDRAAARPRFGYIPFGAGPRICIGSAFAMTEAMILLASLAQQFRARLVPGQAIEPHGLITLRIRGGLKMTIEPRR